MHMENNRLKPSRKFSDFLFERALPNEYLVVVGKKNISPVLGGKKFRWFNKFIHVPAFVQRLKFSTDNANVDYQGIEIHGYASWRINPDNPAKSIATLLNTAIIGFSLTSLKTKDLRDAYNLHLKDMFESPQE